ncbi:substrate-binding periplasmic protein [Piscirickettsia litoralis]|uniref:substrate-binding periplasmic protein n=1 Tax=Piscirickettsia litoralis TaxID=1891921 RepID=UPI0029390ABA|nr:transporter substrate-binding domain-containing protein [Piscirickettsia litoralis]
MSPHGHEQKKLAQQGLYDGIFTIWYTPEREKHFIYSKGFIPNILGFYSLENSKIENGRLKSLEGYNVGVVRSYANPKALMVSPVNIFIGNSDEENTRLLINRRLDAILIDKYVGQSLFYKNAEKGQKLRWLTPAVAKKNQYFAVSRSIKNAREIIDAFNQGLETLRKSGEYDKLVDKLARPQ